MINVMRVLLLCLCYSLAGMSAAQDEAETQTRSDVNTSRAPWKICNETSFILRIATGHTDNETVKIRGWKKLRPSECQQEDITPNIPRFLYAESAAVHNGGIREWAGQAPLCVNPNDNFAVDMSVSCALQGLETRRFLHINPEENTTSLIEPDDYKAKAETAGVQRLLKDAGYKISRIDGIDGRRTRDTLKAFLKDYDINSKLSAFEKIDALEDAALSQQDLTGLTLCNKMAQKTWTAIGYREDGAWQSRGWWGLEPNKCIRPWTKDLIGTEMHIYAYKILDDTQSLILKNPLETKNNFCIAESKFSAIGREFCTDKGYSAANFRAVVTTEKGLQVNLSENDFTDAVGGGLR